MIRTAFAVLFVVASASAALASPQSAPHTAPQTASECSTMSAEREQCGDRRVIRGYADLATRHIAAAAVDAIATA